MCNLIVNFLGTLSFMKYGSISNTSMAHTKSHYFLQEHSKCLQRYTYTSPYLV